MKIRKTTLFILPLLLFLVILMFPVKTTIIFFLDDSRSGSISFEKSIIFNDEKNLKEKFNSLVKNINDKEFDLYSLVYISEKLEKGYKGKALSEIRKSFGWINDESLYHIIEGKRYSAFLLTKNDRKNYMLFFDNKLNKFYFGYDKEIYFQPLIVGWVNNLYSGGVKVLDKGVASIIFNNEETCFFHKGGVSIHGDQLLNGDSTNECVYGPYKVVKKDNINTVKWSKEPPYQELKNSLDATMQFIKWISN